MCNAQGFEEDEADAECREAEALALAMQEAAITDVKSFTQASSRAAVAAAAAATAVAVTKVPAEGFDSLFSHSTWSRCAASSASILHCKGPSMLREQCSYGRPTLGLHSGAAWLHTSKCVAAEFVIKALKKAIRKARLRHLCLLGCRPQRHGQQPKQRGGHVTSALAARQLARRRRCPRQTAAAVPPARSSCSGRHLQTAEMAAAPLWRMSWVSSRKASGDIKSNRALVVHAQFSEPQLSGQLGSNSVMHSDLATSMHSLRQLSSSGDS